MSVQEALAEAPPTVAGNDAANDDAKKMLEQLQAAEGATSTTDETATENTSARPSTEQNGANGSRSERRGDRDDRRGGRGGGRGRGSRGDYSRNVKSVLTDQEKSSDPEAIRKQVEFYFSDSNLPMDKFLLEQVGGSKNLPVDLKTICSFKRMRRFEPYEAIVEALKASTTLNLVEDDTKVQRKEPLIEQKRDTNGDNLKVYEDKAMPRSVYVKGFPEEKPSTQFDIEAWFAQYGATNAVRLRRNDEKQFKRSVFVEFESEELAKKFLELDPKPKFEDRDLQIMSKKEYCEKKVDDIKAGKIAPSRERSSRGGRGRGRGRGDRRGRDQDDRRDWRERREEDRKNGYGTRSGRTAARTEGDEHTDINKSELEKVRAAVAAEGTAGTKRERDGDDTAEEPPAKRVDAAAAS